MTWRWWKWDWCNWSWKKCEACIEWSENDANGIILSWNIQGFRSLFSIVFSLSIILFFRFFSWKSLEGCQTSWWRPLFGVRRTLFQRCVEDGKRGTNGCFMELQCSCLQEIWPEKTHLPSWYSKNLQKSRVVFKKFFNSSFTLVYSGKLVRDFFLGLSINFPIFWWFRARSQELVAQVAEPSKASHRAINSDFCMTWDGGIFPLQNGNVTTINSIHHGCL